MVSTRQWSLTPASTLYDTALYSTTVYIQSIKLPFLIKISHGLNRRDRDSAGLARATLPVTCSYPDHERSMYCHAQNMCEERPSSGERGKRAEGFGSERGCRRLRPSTNSAASSKHFQISRYTNLLQPVNQVLLYIGKLQGASYEL